MWKHKLFVFIHADNIVFFAVAVSLADGLLPRRVLLHNLKFDEPIASFANAAGVGVDMGSLLGPHSAKAGKQSARSGACTAISFSTGECIHLESEAMLCH